MPKGTAGKLTYTPGQAPVVSTPAPTGEQKLTLKNRAKAWSNPDDPNKFPSLKVEFNVMGTEDELTGEEKMVIHYFSLSKAPRCFQDIIGLATAVGYPEAFEGEPYTRRTDPGVRDLQKFVNDILDYAEQNECVLNVVLKHETYQDQKQAKVSSWMMPDGAEAVSDDTGEAEPEESAEEETPAEPEPEEVKPAPKGKGATKPAGKAAAKRK